MQGNLSKTVKPNGVIDQYEYDSLNRLTSLTNYAPDSTPEDLADNQKLAQYDYTLRADGRKTAATEKFWVDNNGQTTEITNQISWTYDEANRLVDEVFITDADDILGLQTGLLGTSRQWADYHDTFTYDLTGNRLKKTTDEGNDGTVERTVDSTYDANDRLLTETDGTEVTSYAYDHTLQTQKSVVDNGVTQSTTQFAWDLMGRLSVATVTTFTAGVASKVTVR